MGRLGAVRRWAVAGAKAWGDDYKRGFKSIGEWVTETPVKAASYTTLAAALTYIASNNIAEDDFHSVVAKNSALIGDVAPRLRNPSTEEFITRVNDARLGKTLRQLDLVLVSVFYIGDYPLDLKIYKAQHYFFHEFMSSFRGRLAEISFLGATPLMDKAMVDYDVNDQ